MSEFPHGCGQVAYQARVADNVKRLLHRGSFHQNGVDDQVKLSIPSMKLADDVS
jgi:pimeloyl-CoA synthetase